MGLTETWKFESAMKIISTTLASLLSRTGILMGLALSSAAHAVNDLPGGPAVNQLNLHPAASKIPKPSMACTGSC